MARPRMGACIRTNSDVIIILAFAHTAQVRPSILLYKDRVVYFMFVCS